MSAGDALRQAGSSWRRVALALAFGPPIVLSAVRAWLQWQDGRQAPVAAFAVSPLPATASASALFLPWLLAAGLLLLLAGSLWLWWRRGGVHAVQRTLLALWTLLWLGGAGALVVAHANTAQLAPLPLIEARVLGLRPRPPSLRQPGGSEVVLALANQDRPQRVRINDERAARWQTGQRLRVTLSHGRFYGLYVTGWELLGPAPAAQ